MTDAALFPPLVPYTLPPEITSTILDLAERSDLLLIGEVHGTQEIPRVLAGLLEGLVQRGYRGLALEAPYEVRDGLVAWAAGAATEPPAFFTHPGPDGRANAQVLALVRQAVCSTHHLQVLCYDQGSGAPTHRWTDREQWMARNLLDQWRRDCLDSKVVGICGNLHSRLANVPPLVHDNESLWPSFAAWVQELRPDVRLHTIDAVFRSGAFFNLGIREIREGIVAPGQEAVLRHPESGNHTLELYLPVATPATFLRPPAMTTNATFAARHRNT